MVTLVTPIAGAKHELLFNKLTSSIELRAWRKSKLVDFQSFCSHFTKELQDEALGTVNSFCLSALWSNHKGTAWTNLG